MPKLIAIVVGMAVLLGILYWKFAPDFSKDDDSNKEVVLNIVGLNDEESLIRPAIEEYKKVKPNVTINFTTQNILNYRSRIQTQIGSSEGADIITLHNTWVPSFVKLGLLSALPASVATNEEYYQTFYPITKDWLSYNGDVYAYPKGVDGLVLFYNEEILKSAGVNVPTIWRDFLESAVKLTVVSEGKIITAGAAMGATSNVDYWSDIVGMLYLQQPGADIINPEIGSGPEVLKFYTNFITDPQRKSWDVTLPTSTQMFLQGKLAFYFGPASKVVEIAKTNPNLKFKTAPVPQIGTNKAWGSFWSYGVSANSKNQKQAWEFLKFLTSAKVEQQLYQHSLQTKIIGQPYSRIDLQSQLLTDPLAGAFVSQGPIYKSWYLSSGTGDQAINDEIIALYETALNSVLQGSDPKDALTPVSAGIKPILEKYTIVK